MKRTRKQSIIDFNELPSYSYFDIIPYDTLKLIITESLDYKFIGEEEEEGIKRFILDLVTFFSLIDVNKTFRKFCNKIADYLDWQEMAGFSYINAFKISFKKLPSITEYGQLLIKKILYIEDYYWKRLGIDIHIMNGKGGGKTFMYDYLLWQKMEKLLTLAYTMITDEYNETIKYKKLFTSSTVLGIFPVQFIY